jgi:hypothetical protein
MYNRRTLEHEVYMSKGTILIVIDLKLDAKDLPDHFAQALLELACEYFSLGLNLLKMNFLL